MSNALLLNKHILIVEDDKPSRLLLEIILEEAGCSFEVAVNGQEAIDKVKEGKFDVVLMDVRMPVLTGYEATRAIRDVHKDLPIIAVTAHAMQGVRERCFSYGMNDYLTKPFDQGKLVEMLLKWVK